MAALGPRIVIAGTHSGVGKTTVATGHRRRARGTRGPRRDRQGRARLHRPRLPLAGERAPRPQPRPVALRRGRHPSAGRPGRRGSRAPRRRGGHGAVRRRRPRRRPVVRQHRPRRPAPRRAGRPRRRRRRDEHARWPRSSPGSATSTPGSRSRASSSTGSASDGHEALLRERARRRWACPSSARSVRDDTLTWRDRHLGLIPVVEHGDEVRAALDRLAATIARARRPRPAWSSSGAGHRTLRRRAAAPGLSPAGAGAGRPWPRARRSASATPTTSRRWRRRAPSWSRSTRCRRRPCPNGVDGLVAGGGFPEVYAAELAANAPLLADVRRRVDARADHVGRVRRAALAEPGARRHRARGGVARPSARMTDRLTLGYRSATHAIGLSARARRARSSAATSSTTPPSSRRATRSSSPAAPAPRRAASPTPTLLASYLHVHLGGDPTPAERFVATCAARRA